MQTKARRDALNRAIVELAAELPFVEVVGWLCCLRGVFTSTARAKRRTIVAVAVARELAGHCWALATM